MKKIYQKVLSNFTFVGLISMGIFFTGCSKENNDNNQTKGEKPSKTVQEQASAAPVNPVDDGKGIGPIKTVSLGPINPKLVADGKKIFDVKCTPCHNIDTKKVGPSLKGVTQRRKPEWILNMVLNPAEMTQKDPTAKKLFSELLVQMANQNVGQDGAKAIMEYFRDIDSKNKSK